MSSVFNFIPQEVITSIGWTLFHSLWQGCAVTLLLLMALYSVKSKDARLKAFLSTSALFLLIIAAIVSFTFEYKNAQKEITIKYVLFENPVSAGNLDAIANANGNNTDKNLATIVLTKLQYYFTESIPLIVTIWGIGFIFFSIRFLGGIIGTARLRKSIVVIEDNEWISKVDYLRKKINLKKRIGFAESALTKVPLVLGYFKPVVLFPVGLLTGLPQNQIEAIIAHELAHIKRYDVLINFVQSFAEVIFFYNPFVWWISHKIRSERENCCDDIAINLSGDSVTYAKALANVESFKESNEPLFAIPLFKNQNQLLRRIKRMIQKEQNQNGFKEKFAAALIFIGIIVAAVAIKSVNPVKGGVDTQLNKAGFFSSSIFVGDKELTNIEIDTVKSVKGKRSFSYLQKEDGKMKRFKAKMKNGKLTDLSIDGEKVPESKFDSYKDDVEAAFRKVDEDEDYHHGRNRIEISGDFFDSESFSRDMEDLGKDIAESFNSTEFKESMKEFSKGMERFGEEFAKSFNSSEFKRDMRKLKEDIREETKDLSNHYNSREYRKSMENFRDEMNKLKKELKNRKYDDDEDFDSEEFEEKMDEASEKLEAKMEHLENNLSRNHSFNFDGLKSLRNLGNLKSLKALENLDFGTESFDKAMKNFNVNMKGFDVKMKKFGEQMKVFGAYIKEVKELLVDEKIIEDDDDSISLKINSNGIYVDNKKLSDDIYQKVKKIYKKHYNKEFSDDSHFNIND
jgi:beta-lactamase regulating signal transducer with metallopeptidase domain